mmetsp:Transcript_11835/g.28166  ORF Transcript_11835/g.28166 Transcript_11835/m.28166 type:complete len:253 (-) Transcript_11835:657-1415(-)
MNRFTGRLSGGLSFKASPRKNSASWRASSHRDFLSPKYCSTTFQALSAPPGKPCPSAASISANDKPASSLEAGHPSATSSAKSNTDNPPWQRGFTHRDSALLVSARAAHSCASISRARAPRALARASLLSTAFSTVETQASSTSHRLRYWRHSHRCSTPNASAPTTACRPYSRFTLWQSAHSPCVARNSCTLCTSACSAATSCHLLTRKSSTSMRARSRAAVAAATLASAALSMMRWMDRTWVVTLLSTTRW